MRGSEDFLFRTVGENAASAQEHDALYFRNDLRNVVRYEQIAESPSSKLAHRVAQLELGSDIQRVARLIEEKSLRIMDQSSSDQCALGFSRRHL